MLRLHNLRPRPGSRHRVKRLGCGESSGHGKTSGKGHKGQKARSGGSIRLGFEGGQMPLIRRLPKRGFNNAAFHKNFAVVNLSDLARFEKGAVVNEKSLAEANLIRGSYHGIKILGDGELAHALDVHAHKVSASAREKIEKAGGTVTLAERARVEARQRSRSKSSSPESKAPSSEIDSKVAPKRKKKASSKPAK